MAPNATALQPCAIYVHDPYEQTAHLPPRARPHRLPASKLPRSWSMHHRYATELWLHDAMRTHPWRVDSAAEADVAYVAADFARLCSANKIFSGRRVWQAALRDPLLFPEHQGEISRRRVAQLRAAAPPATRSTLPKAFSYQYQACPPWLDNNGTSYVPRDLLWLADFAPTGLHGDDVRFVVTPFVVSKPEWLAGAPGATVPEALRSRWRERKLLFFAGHTPRLFGSRWGHSGVRFDAWQQLRRDARATTKSHSINCTVGAFADCSRLSRDFLQRQTSEWFVRRCLPYCRPGAQLANASASAVAGVCGASLRWSPKQNLARLQRDCKSYAHVQFTPGLLADMHRDASLDWSYDAYLKQAMGHKFCLVARGDMPGTPKINEMIAMGGAGGCLPLFVVNVRPPGTTLAGEARGSEGGEGGGGLRGQSSFADALRRSLPYTRWLDWCDAAFFVSEFAARQQMPAVLAALERVTPAQAAAKRRALRSLRPAFGFWSNSSPNAPSATDFILGELCAMARHARHGTAPTVVGGTPRTGCLLA